jgi:hypothetical protein
MVLSLYQLLRPSEIFYQLPTDLLDCKGVLVHVYIVDSDLLLFLMYIVYILPEPTICASISRSLKFSKFL